MSSILTVGIAVLDDLYPIPTPLVPGEKHRARALMSTFGGGATNAAFAIAQLGGKPRLLTRIGADAAGHTLKNLLEARGIDTRLSPLIEGCQTSRSTIVIEPNGERTIINYLDPNFPDLPDFLPRELPAECDGLLCDVRWEAAALPLFHSAKLAGKPGVLDVDRAPHDLALIDAASHAVFSAQGLREITTIADLHQALAEFARGRDNFLGVTDGSAGVYTHWRGEARHYPSFSVRQVDALGAGDVWHGAFALALCEGMAIEAAIRFASGAAALKVTRAGGALGAPDRAELTAFLKEHAA